MTTCPTCGARGRPVGATTLRAQVEPARLATLVDHDGWRLCSSAACDVVYFRHDAVVGLDATRSIPFHKSDDPARLVCFCFGHSASEIEADVRAHGSSTIGASIRAACKAGRDDCVRNNPQGRCCLGHVGQIIEAATATGTAPESGGGRGPEGHERRPPSASDDDPQGARCGSDEDGGDDCRGSTGRDAPTAGSTGARADARVGLFASAGALAVAVLSSACCWLPLVAIGLGASAAGAGPFFEAWRVPLLAITVALLGVGFYLVYRKPRCAPGAACEVPDPRLRRLNRSMLWVTTALVAAFALFPEYVVAFTGDGGDRVTAAASQRTTAYHIEGMTCPGCVGHAREAIEAIPAVASAAISYERGSAEVVWSGAVDHAAVSAAIAPLGYRATPAP